MIRNLGLALAAVVVCLFGLEVAVRAITPGIGFQWRNFATDPVNLVKTDHFVEYDSELGWRIRPNMAALQIGPDGIRLTDPTHPAPAPQGAILAVGDSFTFGSEVPATQAWPSQLSRKLGVPVVNAGSGGYGIDQIVLYAERLIPKLKPRLVVMSFIPADIDRAQMDVFSGAPKPYFVLDGDGLALKNVPVPEDHPARDIGLWRSTLGYSALADFIADRFHIQEWHGGDWAYHRVTKDGEEISCRLVRRLGRFTAENGMPLVLVAQYGRDSFIPEGFDGYQLAQHLLKCAADAGIDTIDTWGDVHDALFNQRDG